MNRHLTEVQDWMTTNPFTIQLQDSLFTAYNLMTENDVHRLPVVDESNNLVGIITLSDIVQTVAFGERPVSSGNTETSLLINPRYVRDVMSSDPSTIRPDDTVQDAAELMLENHISGLPVVQSDELIGIITESDIFRLVVESWERLRTVTTNGAKPHQN